jgi:Flp pilus assembly pilin Flp
VCLLFFVFLNLYMLNIHFYVSSNTMINSKNTLRNLKSSQKGAALVEYVTLLGFISIGAIGAVMSLGEKTSDVFDQVRIEIEESEETVESVLVAAVPVDPSTFFTPGTGTVTVWNPYGPGNDPETGESVSTSGGGTGGGGTGGGGTSGGGSGGGGTGTTSSGGDTLPYCAPYGWKWDDLEGYELSGTFYDHHDPRPYEEHIHHISDPNMSYYNAMAEATVQRKLDLFEYDRAHSEYPNVYYYTSYSYTVYPGTIRPPGVSCRSW